MDIAKALSEGKTLEVLEFINIAEFVTKSDIEKEFGNARYYLAKLEEKQLVIKLTDPLTDKLIWKATPKSKTILSAIFATLLDIEAAC